MQNAVTPMHPVAVTPLPLPDNKASHPADGTAAFSIGVEDARDGIEGEVIAAVAGGAASPFPHVAIPVLGPDAFYALSSPGQPVSPTEKAPDTILAEETAGQLPAGWRMAAKAEDATAQSHVQMPEVMPLPMVRDTAHPLDSADVVRPLAPPTAPSSPLPEGVPAEIGMKPSPVMAGPASGIPAEVVRSRPLGAAPSFVDAPFLPSDRPIPAGPVLSGAAPMEQEVSLPPAPKGPAGEVSTPDLAAMDVPGTPARAKAPFPLPVADAPAPVSPGFRDWAWTDEGGLRIPQAADPVPAPRPDPQPTVSGKISPAQSMPIVEADRVSPPLPSPPPKMPRTAGADLHKDSPPPPPLPFPYAISAKVPTAPLPPMAAGPSWPTPGPALGPLAPAANELVLRSSIAAMAPKVEHPATPSLPLEQPFDAASAVAKVAAPSGEATVPAAQLPRATIARPSGDAPPPPPMPLVPSEMRIRLSTLMAMVAPDSPVSLPPALTAPDATADTAIPSPAPSTLPAPAQSGPAVGLSGPQGTPAPKDLRPLASDQTPQGQHGDPIPDHRIALPGQTVVPWSAQSAEDDIRRDGQPLAQRDASVRPSADQPTLPPPGKVDLPSGTPGPSDQPASGKARNREADPALTEAVNAPVNRATVSKVAILDGPAGAPPPLQGLATDAAVSLPGLPPEEFPLGPVATPSGPDMSTPATHKPADPAPVLRQVTAHLLRAETPVTEIRLSPEELGSVVIEVKTEGDRVMMVVNAERADTLDLLRRHSDRLLADLRAAGFGEMDLAFSGQSGGDGRREDQPSSPQIMAQAVLAGPRDARNQQTDLHLPRPATQGSGLYLRV